MPTNRGTDYAETEALLAALSDDDEGMEEWLRELFPGERASLESALTRMSRKIWKLRTAPGSSVPSTKENDR